jgi:hypothetical protein
VIRLARPLAALAVTAVIWGWAVGQYPYVLPPRLTIAAAAAPRATLVTELIVVASIAVLVTPSFALLFRLAAAGRLGEGQKQGEGEGDDVPAAKVPSRPQTTVGGHAQQATVRADSSANRWWSQLAAAVIVVLIAVRSRPRGRHRHG